MGIAFALQKIVELSVLGAISMPPGYAAHAVHMLAYALMLACCRLTCGAWLSATLRVAACLTAAALGRD